MLTILGGLIALVVGVLWLLPYDIVRFGEAYPEVLIVLKGCLNLALIFGGMIAIAAGISSCKDKKGRDKED